MPELPEVKTISSDLEKIFKGDIIFNFELINLKSLRNRNIEYLAEIRNQEIIKIYQHGKNLIIQTTAYSIILHLRMEGKFEIINTKSDLNLNHVIMLFYFKNKILSFNDHRKFATVDIYKIEEQEEVAIFLKKYGPEPWDINKNDFYEQIKNKKNPIKSTLLDQKYMSGLGNIYVDEVLYASKIHPNTRTNLLTKNEIENIVDNSILILKRAIELRGTTISTFHSMGISGMYQEELTVHTRVGQACKKCGAIVEKIKVGGRGTYFCPKEQKEKK